MPENIVITLTPEDDGWNVHQSFDNGFISTFGHDVPTTLEFLAEAWRAHFDIEDENYHSMIEEIKRLKRWCLILVISNVVFALWRLI